MFPIKYSTDGRTWPKLLFSAASDIAHKPKKNIQNCGQTDEKTEKNIRNCTQAEEKHLKLHRNKHKK
jgi:hypothetical protein